MKTIKGYTQYLKYLDETFPNDAPHKIVVMGSKEYKNYTEEHKSPWEMTREDKLVKDTKEHEERINELIKKPPY